MTRISRYFIFAAALPCIFGCSKADHEENGETVEGKEIVFTPDRTTNLRNPLSGWVLYSGLGNMETDFWTRYSSMFLMRQSRK